MTPIDELLLAELRWAHDVVSWVSRFGGPARARGILCAAGEMEEPTEEEWERAHFLVECVRRIPETRPRLVLATAIAGHHVATISQRLRIPAEAARVALAHALLFVADEVAALANRDRLVA